jgi:hypothetical protein
MFEKNWEWQSNKGIMEASTIKGDMLRNNVAKKFNFGVDGVNVFQWSNHGVTKQICDNYAPYYMGVHCKEHHMNLEVWTLLVLPLVKHIESLLHTYFAHSFK